MPTVKTMNNGCDRHRSPLGGDIVEMTRRVYSVLTELRIGTMNKCKIDGPAHLKGF